MDSVEQKKKQERAACAEYSKRKDDVYRQLKKLKLGDTIEHHDLYTAIAAAEFAFGLWIREKLRLNLVGFISRDDEMIKEAALFRAAMANDVEVKKLLSSKE